VDSAQVTRLIDVLKRQHGCYQELKSVLIEQQHALRRFDAAQLDVLHQRGDRLALRIAELESARVELTGASVRLVDLAQKLGEVDRGRLMAVAGELKTLADETCSLGRINSAAVQCMLNHFHGMYRLMAQAGRPELYAATGRRPQRADGAFLVDQVA
jgi:flagellar biosynthesis/type III secretory pathway chaperone